jgi:thiol-disulfide isomerase/thioredoxin
MKWSFAWLSVLLLAGCTGRAPGDGQITSGPDSGVAEIAAGETVVGIAAEPAHEEVQLSIVDFEGIQQRIADHRGKVVVMDAWSTSCPPCLAEFHNLVELHKSHAGKDVACISLSFDFEGLGKPEEQQEPVLKFLRSQGATFDNLLASEESDTLYRKFKLAAVPAVFVYDRAGQLRKRFDNEQAKSKAEAFTYEQVRELVAKLIAEARPAGEGSAAPVGETNSAN